MRETDDYGAVIQTHVEYESTCRKDTVLFRGWETHSTVNNEMNRFAVKALPEVEVYYHQ